MTFDPKYPLCVDCDGTLIRTDLLLESILLLAKRSWLSLFMVPLWMLRGKAALKHEVAARVSVDVASLPYNDDVIALAISARRDGRTVVLATASTTLQALAISKHLKLFDQVEATSSSVNLSGRQKAERLVRLFGRGKFIYVGNSRADLPVWEVSGGAIVVSSSQRLVAAAQRLTQDVQAVSPGQASPKTYAKALRIHQWLKNLLVFVPMLAAHQLASQATLIASSLSFLAFGLCASAVYVVNDLLDLTADRRHARKRSRPFASGAISVAKGAVLVPLLLFGSALVCTQLPWAFSGVLMGYFAVTSIYSLWLKNQVIVDVLLLASLYTSRILAGCAATGIAPSFWLLAFSMFMFLSLAIVKRYSEMTLLLRQEEQRAVGRGYFVSDMPVLLALGAASGYCSILVMALYIHSKDTIDLYPNHWALWMTLPPLLYWISRAWMKSHRGELHDDPVVFAATDWQSWLVTLLIAGALWFGSSK